MNQPARKPIRQHMQERFERLHNSFFRVVSLVDLHKELQSSPNALQRDDVLRAAVVLLHATLEDLLRGIAASHLPLARESALNGVPLVGLGQSSRTEKFSLGQLASHRGKTVDQVLSESVEQHLQQSSFNSCEDIATLLGNLEVDMTAVRASFPKLDELMRRRHQIVHRGDRVSLAGPATPEAISSQQVIGWVQATVEFVQAVLKDLTLADANTGRLQSDLGSDALQERNNPDVIAIIDRLAMLVGERLAKAAPDDPEVPAMKEAILEAHSVIFRIRGGEAHMQIYSQPPFLPQPDELPPQPAPGDKGGE